MMFLYLVDISIRISIVDLLQISDKYLSRMYCDKKICIIVPPYGVFLF